MTMKKKQAVAADYSTEGLLDQLLNILSSTNNLLADMDGLELGIHESKAEGEPVSTGANDVIALLDSVRGNFEEARETMLTRLDVLVGKATPEPPPPPVEEEEEEEVEAEE